MNLGRLRLFADLPALSLAVMHPLFRTADPDFVEMMQEIGGIVIDADRTRTFELTLRGQPQTSEARRHDHALRPR